MSRPGYRTSLPEHWEKEPAKRFATAAEFLEALRSQNMPDLAGTTTMIPPPNWGSMTTSKVSSQPHHRTP